MSNAHSTREALMAALLADVDLLLRRHEALAPALSAAGDKLARDVREAIVAHDAAAAEAKASIGAYVVHHVNQATARARAEIDEAAAQARAASAAELEALIARAVQQALDRAGGRMRTGRVGRGTAVAIALAAAILAALPIVCASGCCPCAG